MKRLLWNLKITLLFWRQAGLSPRLGWQIARGDDDGFNDGLSPHEVFDNEVSYWNN